jgi:hypothetical protein
VDNIEQIFLKRYSFQYYKLGQINQMEEAVYPRGPRFWGPRPYSFRLVLFPVLSHHGPNKHNAQPIHTFRLLFALKSKYRHMLMQYVAVTQSHDNLLLLLFVQRAVCDELIISWVEFQFKVLKHFIHSVIFFIKDNKIYLYC